MGQIIMLLIGITTALIYSIFYILGSRKYSQMVEGVRDDVFPVKDILVVGIEVIDKFKISTQKQDVKTRQKFAELFGKQYIDFYLIINKASTISYVMLFVPLAFLFGAMTNEVVMVFLILVVAVMLPVYVKMSIDSKIKAQHEEILLDYPNILSKMALLINAGMMLREAWDTVSESGSRKMYIEMQNVTKKIRNGYSDIQSYEEMADACKVNEIKKFISIICQNTEKGSSELVHIMKELSVDAWNVKKSVAKMKGDAASAKLIIPVGITFVGILIMIIIPIVSNMNLGV